MKTSWIMLHGFRCLFGGLKPKLETFCLFHILLQTKSRRSRWSCQVGCQLRYLEEWSDGRTQAQRSAELPLCWALSASSLQNDAGQVLTLPGPPFFWTEVNV